MSDVLIVGGGSAGSVLAERLSADPACRVTLVEAGPGFDDPVARALMTDATVLPIGADSPVARHYRSTLTDHPPRIAGIVRGACLGGSGAVNGGYFCRALPGDFDAVPGWSWADVSEHYSAIESRIAVDVTREFSPVTAAFTAAAQRSGYRWLPSLSTDASGVAVVPLNIAHGARIGPGVAFLAPALARPNLTVLTRTAVTRIRTAGVRVLGVDAAGPGGALALDADRVVLSAGAIATAQLLLLSGIGPAMQLRALGIDVVADLPVGQRCWDHPEWMMATASAALRGRPVLEVVLVTEGLEIRPYTTGFGSPTANIGVALMGPRAHGRVSLVSTDPSAPPRIEHRYDSEPADVAALRRGCELVTEMLSGTADLGEPAWSTSQHLCGTAPMGNDEHGVVDACCRVHGVAGLSVADGSVLPGIPGRGPHATIAMIGHRVAEFV